MKKIIDYKLVEVRDERYLGGQTRTEEGVRKVAELLDEGWQPFGSPTSMGSSVYQAFVQYDD